MRTEARSETISFGSSLVVNSGLERVELDVGVVDFRGLDAERHGRERERVAAEVVYGQSSSRNKKTFAFGAFWLYSMRVAGDFAAGSTMRKLGVPSPQSAAAHVSKPAWTAASSRLEVDARERRAVALHAEAQAVTLGQKSGVPSRRQP